MHYQPLALHVREQQTHFCYRLLSYPVTVRDSEGPVAHTSPQRTCGTPLCRGTRCNGASQEDADEQKTLLVNSLGFQGIIVNINPHLNVNVHHPISSSPAPTGTSLFR